MDWRLLLKIVLDLGRVGDAEGRMREVLETHRSIPDWEESVSKLIVADEVPPETDERVYLTGDRRYASTMTEHLHRYRLARLFAVGLKVLDLGCGSGYGTALLGEVAEAVVGVDYDEGAIGWARRHCPHTDFRVMDAVELTFPDRSFDLVVSLELIEHIADIDAYLSEACRVLRPGGGFLFSTPHTPSPTGELTFNPDAFPHKWGFTHEFLLERLPRYFTNIRLFSQRHDRFMNLTIPCYYMGLCWKEKEA